MTGPLHARLGEKFFTEVPSKPGVYMMLGEGDELLYVGKAKNLRTRLRSYARVSAGDEERRVLLVTAVRSIKWEECETEALAVGRETELLRAMRPPFNFTHTSASEYLAIAVADRADGARLRLTAASAQEGEVLYGCFPFAAATPDAYKALLRVLFLAQPNSGTRIPSRLTRAAGCELAIAPELRRGLRAYLSGRTMRVLVELERHVAASHAGDHLAVRSAARDLDQLRAFYELGPRALRRLQQRHGMPPAPVTGDELTDLMAREMGTQTGVQLHSDRDEVIARVTQLRDSGHGFRAIARRLNAERVPRLRGGGKWSAVDVAEIVGQQVAAATTTAALSSEPNLRQ